MKTGILSRFARPLAALAASLMLAVMPAFGEVTTETQLKAAYLVNFLKYVEWPGTRTTINLCLFGRDSLGPYVAAYEGRQIGGRELHIHKVSSPEQMVDCHELFIPETEEARFAAVMRWVDKQPILTVSDAEILPTPDVASDMAKRFVCGLLAMDGHMISILALENVLPAQERGEPQ